MKIKTASVFLFSQSTKLAYKIDKKFYGNKHYVWCSESIHDVNQPPTSDPISRCNRMLQIIKTGDRHASEINGHISGILAGVQAKYKSGEISKKQKKLICECITYSTTFGYKEFLPIIYVINYKKVKDRCEYVKFNNKASNHSSEIRITDLKPDEYSIIDTGDLLNGVIETADWNRGDLNEKTKI